MLLCELKVVREDNTPASDAVHAFANHFSRGWEGGKAETAKEGKSIDQTMQPIVEAIVSGYPVSSSLSHAELKKMMSDNDAREKATICMSEFPNIIIHLADQYLTGLKQFKDNGLRHRVELARAGKNFDKWILDLQKALTIQLEHASPTLTSDPDALKRIATIFADPPARKIVVEAVMSSKSVVSLVNAGVLQIKIALNKKLPTANGDAATVAATKTINTAEAFIGFCRALLENHFQIKRQISPFLLSDED